MSRASLSWQILSWVCRWTEHWQLYQTWQPTRINGIRAIKTCSKEMGEMDPLPVTKVPALVNRSLYDGSSAALSAGAHRASYSKEGPGGTDVSLHDRNEERTAALAGL